MNCAGTMESASSADMVAEDAEDEIAIREMENPCTNP